MPAFHFVKHCRKSFRSKPVIVTFREIIECTVARPSRSIKINFEFGYNSDKYAVDFNENGSLLQSRSAGGPCPAIT